MPEKNIHRPSIYPWQKNIWDRLNQQIENKRLPHALLLQGAPDSGLNDFATFFSTLLLCVAPENNYPCGRCRECLLVLADTHPGFIKITPVESEEGKISKVIKIDQIREIIDVVTHTSMLGGQKVILIYPAELMNQNAANALLKSLEEPPANTQFLLVTNMPGKLMPTIRSRCQIIDMSLPSLKEADHWLAKTIHDSHQRQKLLALSGGNALLVSKWQESAISNDIFNLRSELASLLSRESSEKVTPLLLAKNWLGSGAQRLGWWWRWLLLEAKQVTEQDSKISDSNFSLTQKQLLEFMQKLLTAKRQLESSANPNEQLLLESLLIDWQNLKHS